MAYDNTYGSGEIIFNESFGQTEQESLNALLEDACKSDFADDFRFEPHPEGTALTFEHFSDDCDEDAIEDALSEIAKTYGEQNMIVRGDYLFTHQDEFWRYVYDRENAVFHCTTGEASYLCERELVVVRKALEEYAAAHSDGKEEAETIIRHLNP